MPNTDAVVVFAAYARHVILADLVADDVLADAHDVRADAHHGLLEVVAHKGRILCNEAEACANEFEIIAVRASFRVPDVLAHAVYVTDALLAVLDTRAVPDEALLHGARVVRLAVRVSSPSLPMQYCVMSTCASEKLKSSVCVDAPVVATLPRTAAHINR